MNEEIHVICIVYLWCNNKENWLIAIDLISVVAFFFSYLLLCRRSLTHTHTDKKKIWKRKCSNDRKINKKFMKILCLFICNLSYSSGKHMDEFLFLLKLPFSISSFEWIQSYWLCCVSPAICFLLKTMLSNL